MAQSDGLGHIVVHLGRIHGNGLIDIVQGIVPLAQFHLALGSVVVDAVVVVEGVDNN